MNSPSSYTDILKTTGFRPFLLMQFLNAFNDNVYKLVVSLLAVLITARGVTSGTYLSFAGFIFVAPFLLFSAYAGQLADRFEKRTVVILTKAIEIFAMVLALFALVSGNVLWMLVVLFFTATQAAIFSPAKYGIVPELVEECHLARANGLLEMSTFVAIILGTVAGTTLVAFWKQQPLYIGLVLIAVAIVGTLASLRIRHTPAPTHRRPFSWSPLGDLFTGLDRLKTDRVLRLAVLGTTFFWFLGALFQMLLLLFGKETLHCTDTQSGMLLASLALGIGIGSMAAGKLSGDIVEFGLVPVGAFGMALATFGLAFAPHTLLLSIISLAGLGFMGGLFIVPLNAILQHRPAHDEKGRVLATANFVNTVGIMGASGVIWLLHEALHLSAPAVVGVAAALTTGAACYALQLVPNFTVRFLLFLLTHAVYRIRIFGSENIPQNGPALLVANHVSYVDGFLIGACVSPFVRFLVNATWFDRVRPLFQLFNAIRVPTGNRRAVLKAIEIAREQLQQGQVVCIFAEGALTLNGNLGEFQRGLERISEDLDVPVIPVHLGGLWGSIFSLDRRASLSRSLRRLPFPITVSFGKALLQPKAVDARQAVCELGATSAVAQFASNGTLAARLVRCARQNWSHRAATELTGRTLTYGQLLTASYLLSRTISTRCKDQHRIGIMLPACTAAALANIGVVLSGRVVVNLNFTTGREALDSAIRQCELRTILTSRQFVAKAKLDRLPQMVFVEDLLAFGVIGKCKALLAARLLPAKLLCPVRVRAEDVAAILFSSGSTGEPKGIQLSHANLISNTDAVNQLFPVDYTTVIAGVLPFFHAFGFTYTLWFPLLHGASAAYHPQPLDGKGIGELIQKAKATFLPAPPTFCQAYLRACSKEQFASLRYVLVGGERLSPELAQAFEEKLGLPLLEGYGATEMSPVVSVNVPDRERAGVKQIGRRAGTVGQLIPGVAAKVVNPESGQLVKPGEEGLLLVKGPNRMLGYLNRPEETLAAFQGDWFVTGDIVRLDEDGFLTIVDRRSRFSKIGGEMVPHGKLEAVLQSLFPEAQCAVTATADPRRGERIVAFITETAAKPRQIWSSLMDSDLPKLWIPRQEDIRLIDTLPLLGSGKLDLATLRKMAALPTTIEV